jgi:hypothetical protein
MFLAAIRILVRLRAEAQVKIGAGDTAAWRASRIYSCVPLRVTLIHMLEHR